MYKYGVAQNKLSNEMFAFAMGQRGWVSYFTVVGMHPDQATEAIVDFAAKYNKPFAVVGFSLGAPRAFHSNAFRDYLPH